MRVLLIHNPKAGDRKHGRKQLMAILTRCGHQTFYQSIEQRGWKEAFKKPVDLVIAAGGDGTVHKTAWQIIDSGLPLAILPLGTANNGAGKIGSLVCFALCAFHFCAVLLGEGRLAV